jgi:dynein heavy chain, axonemal
LETAVKAGQPMVVEISNNEIDLLLDPLLSKRTFIAKKDPEDDTSEDVLSVIIGGDSQIPYNEKFKLYIVSRHPNPQFAPEICTKVNLVHFGVTQTGLEDELLTIVVHEERRELEQQKGQIEESISTNKRILKEIEDKILLLLYQAEGNLLEDEVLIDTLAVSKKTSNDITARLEEAIKTEKDIDDVRIRYQPVAERAAILYQVVMDLANINSMYQFSLAYFVELFVASITDSKGLVVEGSAPGMFISCCNLTSHFPSLQLLMMWTQLPSALPSSMIILPILCINTFVVDSMKSTSYYYRSCWLSNWREVTLTLRNGGSC